MSGNQKISDAAFKKFSDSMDETSQAFSSNLRTLANAIANLDGGQWKGEGHAAFRKAQISLNDDHDAVRRLLDGIREAVVLTHRASGANDGEIASSLNKVDVNGAAPGGHLSSKIDGFA